MWLLGTELRPSTGAESCPNQSSKSPAPTNTNVRSGLQKLSASMHFHYDVFLGNRWCSVPSITSSTQRKNVQLVRHLCPQSFPPFPMTPRMSRTYVNTNVINRRALGNAASKMSGPWLSGAVLITEEQSAHAHLVNGNHQSGLHLRFNFFWSIKTVEFTPSQNTVQPSPANQTFYCLLEIKKVKKPSI